MRKIIQIVAIPETEHDYVAMFALCDDGSCWIWAECTWTRIKDIPQDEENHETK